MLPAFSFRKQSATESFVVLHFGELLTNFKLTQYKIVANRH